MSNVNIQVTATVAQAAKELKDFTSTTTAGLNSMDAASRSAAAGLAKIAGNTSTVASFSRGLSATSAALNHFGRLGTSIGYQVAPQLTATIGALTHGCKALSGAVAISGAGIAATGTAVIGAAGAVAIGISAWNAYKAKLQEIATQAALTRQELDFRDRTLGLVDKFAALDRLPKEEAEALKKRLAAATPEGYRSEFTTRKVLIQVGSGQFGQAFAEREIKEEKRIPTERLDDVLKVVNARLREVVLTDEQLKQMEALKDRVEQLHIQRLEGYDKERAAEVERFRLETRHIEERAQFAKAQDQDTLKLARMENELIHRKTMADIERKEWDGKVKRALELQKIQDEMQLKEWEHAQRIQAAALRRKIDAITSDPTTTDADKFRALLSEGGMSVEAAEKATGLINPDDFGRNLSARIAALRSEIGTFSQGSAKLLDTGLRASLDGITDSITGLITGAKNMEQVWNSILTEMLRQSVKFGVDQTASFVLGENTKTAAALAGAAKRGAAWVAETSASLAAIGKQVAVYVAGQVAMTASALARSAVRIGAALKEAGAWVIQAAVKAASAVADIPYVGWALALAALAGVAAAGYKAIDGARAGGGPVWRDGAFVVGERGPELFVPDQDGTILNNTDTMRVMRAGTTPATGGGESETRVKVVVVSDLQQAMREVLNSAFGEQVIVQTVNGKRLDMGFPT
jgi:hypothetical protein